MPTYEYKCNKCGVFEYNQSITDPKLAKCPECNSSVKRLISNNVNILFKGSGWHITDYRSDSYRKRAKEETNGKNPKVSESCPASSSCPNQTCEKTK